MHAQAKSNCCMSACSVSTADGKPFAYQRSYAPVERTVQSLLCRRMLCCAMFPIKASRSHQNTNPCKQTDSMLMVYVSWHSPNCLLHPRGKLQSKRPRELDRHSRRVSTQTEHMEEAQYLEVAKKVGAHSRGTGATPRAPPSQVCTQHELKLQPAKKDTVRTSDSPSTVPPPSSGRGIRTSSFSPHCLHHSVFPVWLQRNHITLANDLARACSLAHAAWQTHIQHIQVVHRAGCNSPSI